MSKPKVVFEAAPSRWVIEYQNPGQDWAFFERKPTLEAAKEYAQQAMDYASANSAALWRVVDTQPEAVRVGDGTPLTLDTYQEQAAETAVYPYGKADQYLVAGLAGEVGELASLFAKHWRGDGDLNPDHARAELGDVLWFVAMLAKELGYDLSTIAANNLDKLADRANTRLALENGGGE